MERSIATQKVLFTMLGMLNVLAVGKHLQVAQSKHQSQEMLKRTNYLFTITHGR